VFRLIWTVRHSSRAEIDALPELKLVWDAMAAVAAPSPFTPESFTALGASLPAQATVKCTEWGDIYGTGKYEQLNPGWAWTLKNDLMNHLPRKMGKRLWRRKLCKARLEEAARAAARQ
jgi:hypothetical protein